MTETEFSQEIKSQNIRGMYFLYGEEDYTKNYRASAVREIVVGDDATFAAFNYISLSFGDGECDLVAIENALSSPPLFSSQKLVDVWFADLDSIGEKNRSALLALLSQMAESGVDDTVFLMRVSADGFDPGTAKKPSPFLAAASKFMKTVEFSYQTEAKLIRWTERHVREYGLSIDPGTSAMIIERSGRSMYRLVGELEKVAAHAAAHGKAAVTPDDVEACVTLTDDDDAFKLANCVLEGNAAGALSCLAVRMRRRDDPTFVLAQITKVFCDLAIASAFIADGRQVGDYAKEMRVHEYKANLYYRAAKLTTPEFLAASVDRCVETDRMLKTTPLGYAAIERLICVQCGN